MENTLYLGLDVHKDSIVIAVAGRNGEVRLYGAISKRSAKRMEGSGGSSLLDPLLAQTARSGARRDSRQALQFCAPLPS